MTDCHQEATLDAEVTAAPQFNDVMELEEHTQTSNIHNEVSADMNMEIMQDVTKPVCVTSVQHQEIPVTKNVQNDLDLWARIREYDQRMENEGFTQTLSKKQQQAVKKQVLGRALYNTRAKGTHSSSSS
jgi:hypothetical protein